MNGINFTMIDFVNPSRNKSLPGSLTCSAKADRPCPAIYGNQNHHQTRKIAGGRRPLQPCRAHRRLLFCAGQIPIDPATGNLIAGDIKAQTERVLQNVKAILDDQKLTFANVVKSTVFMTNLADFAGMNEVYAKYFTEGFSGAFDGPGRRAAERRERGN